MMPVDRVTLSKPTPLIARHLSCIGKDRSSDVVFSAKRVGARSARNELELARFGDVDGDGLHDGFSWSSDAEAGREHGLVDDAGLALAVFALFGVDGAVVKDVAMAIGRLGLSGKSSDLDLKI
jgi:hypothetical protein